MQPTRVAPRPGQNNPKICCFQFGLSSEELAKPRAARVV